MAGRGAIYRPVRLGLRPYNHPVTERWKSAAAHIARRIGVPMPAVYIQEHKSEGDETTWERSTPAEESEGRGFIHQYTDAVVVSGQSTTVLGGNRRRLQPSIQGDRNRRYQVFR